MTPVVIELQM